MRYVGSLIHFLERLVEHSDLKDWALIATFLIVVGCYFLRKVDG